MATLRTLRAAIPGSGWKYEAPWVLMLGDHGSGKSALASAIGLHRPFALNTDPELARQGCAWHVFERGIVLDPPGGILWGDGRGKGAAMEAGWRRLMQLLLRHRAERGLDAVVVTIPCTDLVGPDRLDANTLIARGKRLRLRLRELQQQLGLRLPVYVVVTKCDALLGFASFWEPMEAERGSEMFGWSNGQTLETLYGPHLVGEAFDAMGRDLHRALIGTAVATGGISDMAFLFPAEFQKLSAPLTRLVDWLFRVDSFQDPHFFRGLYFTGESGKRQAAGGLSGLPMAMGPMGPSLEPPPGLMSGLMTGDSGMISQQDAAPLFVTGLFRDKDLPRGAGGAAGAAQSGGAQPGGAEPAIGHRGRGAGAGDRALEFVPHGGRGERGAGAAVACHRGCRPDHEQGPAVRRQPDRLPQAARSGAANPRGLQDGRRPRTVGGLHPDLVDQPDRRGGQGPIGAGLPVGRARFDALRVDQPLEGSDGPQRWAAAGGRRGHRRLPAPARLSERDGQA